MEGVAARTLSSMLGISIPTGQASKQAPHNVEALARWPYSDIPKSAGESTEPIGPE